MIPKGLFTQIGMMIISVGIIITYIQPSFAEVEVIQDNIEKYQIEREKVVSVNSKLSSLALTMDSVSGEDKRRLQTYLPDAVDSISVSRDIYLITEQAGVFYKGVEYAGQEKETRNRNRTETTSDTATEPHTFSLTVEATYEQLKDLLRLLEQNSYPLEVHNMEITKMEGGFLGVSLDLVTYSFRNEVSSN